MTRAEAGQINIVRDLLAAAASPGSPYIAVTRLSDLAGARTTTDDSLTTFGIALLVGGVGIANTMIVAVMERRGEIELRRSLGARPGQIATQFLTEAAILSLLGGLAGLGLGAAATVIAAVTARHLVIPSESLAVGPAVAVLVGALAELHPATLLSPTAALRGA